MSSGPSIRLVLADVDGTLVNAEKELTPATVAAVGRLHDAGIAFAVTSGRPPRGMQMLVEPLRIQTPLAAFNGGLLVNPDMSVLEERTIAPDLVAPCLKLFQEHGLDGWVYRGADWLVRDPAAAHVERESATVRFAPTIVPSFDGLADGVAKLVGVSDDHDRVAQAEAAARDAFGQRVSAARSQPYYLDVTHPDANKGVVATTLAHRLGISTQEIATLGDMPNDVLMFAHSGLSIAMGNSSPEVQRAARRVTSSNTQDGFAHAVDRFILTAT